MSELEKKHHHAKTCLWLSANVILLAVLMWLGRDDDRTVSEAIETITTTMVNVNALAGGFTVAFNWRRILRAIVRFLERLPFIISIGPKNTKAADATPAGQTTDATSPPTAPRPNNKTAGKQRLAVVPFGGGRQRSPQDQGSKHRIRDIAIIAAILAGIVGIAVFGPPTDRTKPSTAAPSGSAVRPVVAQATPPSPAPRDINGLSCVCAATSAVCRIAKGMDPKDIARKFYGLTGDTQIAKANQIWLSISPSLPGKSDREIPAGTNVQLADACPQA